jgi:integrase
VLVTCTGGAICASTYTRTSAGAPRSAYGSETDAGTGTGARQSELFALAVGNIDFLRRRVHIRVQIKIVGGRLVFAAPKSKAERSVPLARQTGAALAAHLQLFPRPR